MKSFKKLIGDRIFLAPKGTTEEEIEKFTEWMNDFQVTDYIGVTSGICTLASEKEYLEKTPVSLKEYLKMISFVIDNYSPSCKYYKDSNLYLEISAKIDEEKSVTYKVPIKFNNC